MGRIASTAPPCSPGNRSSSSCAHSNRRLESMHDRSRSTPRLRLTCPAAARAARARRRVGTHAATGVAGQALQLAGLLCVACAALGRIWSSIFIAGYKDARLVRRGPYAMLRHPLYALSSLAMLARG